MVSQLRMKIKRLPNIDRRAYKGLFKPLNPQKYKGNHKNIIYRSSWEKRFMGYCDKKKEIIDEYGTVWHPVTRKGL